MDARFGGREPLGLADGEPEESHAPAAIHRSRRDDAVARAPALRVTDRWKPHLTAVRGRGDRGQGSARLR